MFLLVTEYAHLTTTENFQSLPEAEVNGACWYADACVDAFSAGLRPDMEAWPNYTITKVQEDYNA